MHRACCTCRMQAAACRDDLRKACKLKNLGSCDAQACPHLAPFVMGARNAATGSCSLAVVSKE